MKFDTNHLGDPIVFPSDDQQLDEQLLGKPLSDALRHDEIDAVVKNADVILYQTLHAGDKVLADDGSEWTMASTNEIRISDDVVVERCNHDEESE
jgi:hypothetical protein